MKNAPCVYEPEYVFMKGQSKGFLLSLIGGALRRRLENHENATCVKGICAHKGK